MTVKECYSQMNGDYNNVLSRFYDEAMIKRLLGRFIDDTSFRALEQAMAEDDVQAAFNAAHTLRGVYRLKEKEMKKEVDKSRNL